MSADVPCPEIGVDEHEPPSAAVPDPLELTHQQDGNVVAPPSTGTTPKRSFTAWRLGLVVSASALCGGIAVVLWNRRLLARMRDAPPAGPAEPYSWEDDA